MAAKKTQTKAITAYKGFDKDLKCRGFQFEVGQTYEYEGNVEACQSGFHACLSPHDVWSYYRPGQSRFCIVELGGETSKSTNDSKIAAAKITITAELDLASYIQAVVEHTWKAAKLVKGAASATGSKGAASARGYKGAASATGYKGAASATGTRGAAFATGDWSAASATGYGGAASATGTRGTASATGDWGAAFATGDWGAASATGYKGTASATGSRGTASATGYKSTASATGSKGAASATSDWGAASATGYKGAASATGDWGAASATGFKGAAMASGLEGRVKGTNGNCLFAVERKEYDYEPISTASGIVGKDGIKPDTWYVCKDGELVEAAGASDAPA